ncbi:MAG TPA: hypothetical protein ENG03_12110 [Thioploca sp.]|nr:MAG: hypothetical protein DRR19_21685 [Gammaproteobacteria bacterium]HDN27811.1 hypothetical protein [Thioploca sp.]
MIEPGLIKMGGARLLGTAFSPNVAILIMGGIIAWQFWKNRQLKKTALIIDARAENEALATLKTGIDVLVTEQRDISVQVAKLQEKLLEFKKAESESETSIRHTPINAFMNKASSPTKEPAKLAMFKRVIEDNVKLRETT